MNFKTTVGLAIVLLVMLSLYAFSRSVPKPPEPVAPPTMPASAASRDLIEKKLGDVVKAVCQVKGKDPWTFEKKTPATEGATATWRMSTPMDAPVASWEAERFGRDLGSVKYELSFKPGEPGAVSLADAGLSPPEATVTLTDAEGASATVEIGKPAGSNETYVRLAGQERICVAKSNLRTLLKPRALEYRDMLLWSFAPEDATRVEIEDRAAAGGAAKFLLVREGGKWVMQSPAAAKATGKVDDVLRSVSRFRVSQWYDDAKEKLATYGLESPSLTLRVTVEEKVPSKAPEAQASPEGEEETKEEAPPQTKTSVYVLHVSDRTPIGDDAKVYVRAGDETAVATAMKSTTDKLRPVLSEWRDMKLTSANVEAATRIELQVKGQSAALVGKDGQWSFDGEGGKAEESAVKDLLKAIKDLNAEVFIDADPASMGFSQPVAEVRLTVPGADAPERIVIGGYTDEKTRLMAYARRNESTSAGKVRSSAIEPLLKAPSAYRDRTVTDIPGAQVQKLTVSLENRFVGGRDMSTYERRDGSWTQTVPVTASVRADRMDALVGALTALHANSIVSSGDRTSAFGLDAPKATVTLVHQVAADPDLQDQPAPVEIKLDLTLHDGKCFVRRGDQPTIFEVAADVYNNKLLAELRSAEVLTFEDPKVKEFSIRKGDQTHDFTRSEGKWTYKAEPDFPLDPKKVDNLLLQLKDLKTERYVRSAAPDLGAFGLASPAIEATVTLEDGTVRTLHVSAQTSDREADKGHFASVDDRRDVFLLTTDTLKRFEVNLAELEKR